MNNREETIALLQENVLFKNIPVEVIQALLTDSLIVTYTAGDIICREKEESGIMYIIISGSLTVYSAGEDKNMLLAELHAGNFFGEIAMLTKTQRTATVAAKTDCKLLTLTMDSIAFLKEHYPQALSELYESMLKILCERIKIIDRRMKLKSFFAKAALR